MTHQEKIDIKDNVGFKVVKGDGSVVKEKDFKKKEQTPEKDVEFSVKLKMKASLKLFLESTANKAGISMGEMVSGLTLDAARIHMLFTSQELGEIIKLKREEQRLIQAHRIKSAKIFKKQEQKMFNKQEQKAKRKAQKEARKKNR